MLLLEPLIDLSWALDEAGKVAAWRVVPPPGVSFARYGAVAELLRRRLTDHAIDLPLVLPLGPEALEPEVVRQLDRWAGARVVLPEVALTPSQRGGLEHLAHLDIAVGLSGLATGQGLAMWVGCPEIRFVELDPSGCALLASWPSQPLDCEWVATQIADPADPELADHVRLGSGPCWGAPEPVDAWLAKLVVEPLGVFLLR